MLRAAYYGGGGSEKESEEKKKKLEKTLSREGGKREIEGGENI